MITAMLSREADLTAKIEILEATSAVLLTDRNKFKDKCEGLEMCMGECEVTRDLQAEAAKAKEQLSQEIMKNVELRKEL